MVKSPNSSSVRRNQLSLQTPQKPINWLDAMIDHFPRLAIPIGPQFQADVPAWTSPSKHDSSDSESDTSKWFGSQIWPVKGQSPESKVGVIGKGRPDFCKCVSPGTVECIKHHINDKRVQLQYDLGSVFWSWKFNEMGEEVSKFWTLQEQRTFASLVKSNPVSQRESFLKRALQCLPSKSREDIVSYYFNVFVPRRIKMYTMSGCKVDDSDDDVVTREERSSKDSQKRCRGDTVVLHGSKHAKTRYLTGLR